MGTVDSVAPPDRVMEDKGSRVSQCLYAFVKWLEDPPKWNVVPVKHVKSKGELKTGQVVEVKWGSAYHRARLIDIGKCTLNICIYLCSLLGL